MESKLSVKLPSKRNTARLQKPAACMGSGVRSAASRPGRVKGGSATKNRLEELRRQHGIRQEELADALGVSRQTIGSLENGRYNPSILLAFKLARYFGLAIEDIFLYEEEQP